MIRNPVFQIISILIFLLAVNIASMAQVWAFRYSSLPALSDESSETQIRLSTGFGLQEGGFVGVDVRKDYLSLGFLRGNWGGPNTYTGFARLYFKPLVYGYDGSGKWYGKVSMTFYREKGAPPNKATFVTLRFGRDMYMARFMGVSLEAGLGDFTVSASEPKRFGPSFGLSLWGQLGVR